MNIFLKSLNGKSKNRDILNKINPYLRIQNEHIS